MSQRFVAELTALPTRKECGYKANCRGQRIYNQSVEFQFVENVDPTQPGRDCCPACTRYLRSKATTVHNLEPNPATTDREVWSKLSVGTTASRLTFLSVGENEAKIYQMINQNQRKSEFAVWPGVGLITVKQVVIVIGLQRWVLHLYPPQRSVAQSGP